jgi:hypothetical protein
VSREQVERGVDVGEAFAVYQPILPLSGGALGLVEKPLKVLARCLAIPRLVSATDDDVQAGPTPPAKFVAPSSEKRVQLLQLDTHGKACGLKGVRGESADVFLESLEIHHAFRENPVDERTRAAQQLGRRFRRDGHCWWRGRAGQQGVCCGLCLPHLCPFSAKLARGQVGETSASVCHEGELDAQREMGERLELVVAGWYDLLALFPAVAEERRVVAD